MAIPSNRTTTVIEVDMTYTITARMTEPALRSDSNENAPQRLFSAKYRNSLTRYQTYVRPRVGTKKSQASSQGFTSSAARASSPKRRFPKLVWVVR